jgi:hypothetical protein
MYKRCEVVPLTTNQKAGVIWLTNNNQLIHTHVSGKYKDKYTPQHLHIVSDEDIVEGDYRLHLTEYTINHPHHRLEHGEKYATNQWRKIIATTDDNLCITRPNATYPILGQAIIHLPQPSQSFIAKFIEQYNKGNIITHIMVEYYTQWSRNTDRNVPTKDDLDEIPKLSKDNTITIKPVKNSWSRNEIVELCKSAFLAGIKKGTKLEADAHRDNKLFEDQDLSLNKWIENNLL